jgi:NADH-quinone oxidoreductase subunit H
MIHVLNFVEAVATGLLDAAAILGFLLLGLVCIAVLERKIARSMTPEPAQRSVDLPQLLERLTYFLKSYVRELLAQDAGRFLPWLASIANVASGVVGFAALSFGPAVRLADLNTGLIFVFGASLLGIYGGVLSRGFSARADSLAGLARNATRLASFEAAAALALVSGIILAGSISVTRLVEAQLDQGAWFLFLAPLGFLLYLASSIAAIDSASRPLNRPAFEREGTAPLDATTFRWPFGSLGASIHLLVGAGIATTVFLGGWLRPFASYRDRFAGTSVELLDALPPVVIGATAAYCFRLAYTEQDGGRKQFMMIASGICAGLFLLLAGVLFAPAAAMAAVHGAFWFLMKMAAYVYAFLWLRARIPRLRFGRPIRAAWNFLIPLAAVNTVGVAAALVARQRWGWGPASSTIVTTASALAIAIWLGLHDMTEAPSYGLES